MPGHHHHHRGGGRRGFRGRGVVVVDNVPDYYVSSSCYRERQADGSFVLRCPDDDAGDLLPTIVTPDDARHQIDETDLGYDRLNIAIAASSAPPEFKASWAVQLGAWKTYAAGARATVGILNTKAVMDQTDRYQQQLKDWDGSFRAIGGIAPGPKPSTPGQGVPDTQTASLLSGTTGLIVAGAALAAVLILGPRFSK